MRKRAQLRYNIQTEEPAHIAEKIGPKIETKPFRFKKNWWIAITLISAFLLVLFLNTYFNLTSGASINPDAQGFSKYYLSGPDPYYNMRLVSKIHETGIYPYYSSADPLLNYPLGSSGGRAPLLNMMAIGFSRFLAPFMNEIDAIGYSMQFIPALFGALLIFPVYFIGKELFNKKAGLIGALFVAMIPIHLSSGHGSSYTLFDHDSFNLLLFFITFLFLIKSIKEKETIKSILFAILGGVSLAALNMTWVEAQFLFVVIAIYAVVQMIFDIFTNKIEMSVPRSTSIILLSGYFISLPVIISRGGFSFDTTLFLGVIVAVFGLITFIFARKKIPWTISIPGLIIIGIFGLIFLYVVPTLSNSFQFLSPLTRLSQVIFGTGIYGEKVSMTIAEANTYEISHTVMSFGPALYWIAWAGFVLLLFYYYKNKQRKDYLFIIILFIIDIWLAGTAGRFLNDMVPLIALLGGWAVWFFVDWLDYKQMIRNIRGAGGGLHGIRKGMKFLHVFGILFIAFLVILPNVFVSFDAAIPSIGKRKDDKENWTTLKGYMFGDDSFQGAYGLVVYKENYWVDAFNWLNSQDNDISDPAKRPAFISWWDYGFYEVALGGHPTVADNFQDGIPTAANFHTSVSEREAVVVLSIRLLEGDMQKNGGKFSDATINVLENRVGINNTEKITKWMKKSTDSPSCGKLIWTGEDTETYKDYKVGQQYGNNAVYHDIVDLLVNDSLDPETNETIGLSDEEVTWLYHDLQESTGYSIRYYGVEGYDRQIFDIFGFLADKSLLLVTGISDDFKEWYYSGYQRDRDGNKVPNSDFNMSAKQLLNMDISERKNLVIEERKQVYNDPYFETMFYKTYIGPSKGDSGSKQEFDWQIPCLDMKHFYAEYISDLTKFPYQNTRKASVVIAKYYEGAYINGTVTFLGNPLEAQVVIQKNLTYYQDVTFPIDHDIDNTDASSGAFSVLAGGGNDITLVVRRDLGLVPFIIKNVTFNSLDDSNLAPISDADAMRRNGSNYERLLNINVEPASIEGYVFNDIDYDGVFNKSVDETLPGVTVNMFQITSYYYDETTGEQKVSLDTNNPIILTTNETGYYNTSGLLPGVYRLIAQSGDFTIHFNDVNLYEGNNTYDPMNAKPGRIEGVVFTDVDGNDEYDSDDEVMSDVDVQLIFNTKVIKTTKTDANGKYLFESLVPGPINGIDINPYTINATKPLAGSTNLEYQSIVTVYPLENETTYQNISIEYATIAVAGTTKYKDAAKSGIEIDFVPDGSVADNTASMVTTTSIEDGSYTADLLPGSYNVTIAYMEQQVLVYSFEGKLSLTPGQGTATYPISLNKNSSTVTGTTSYNGLNVPNVSIALKNDTYIYAITTKSDETGYYTVELTPATYTVTVEHDFIKDGQNYTYKFAGTLEIVSAPSDVTNNIAMTREETD